MQADLARIPQLLLALAIALAPSADASGFSPVEQRSASSSSALWLPPLAGNPGVSRPFDLANGPYQAGHRGVDFPTEAGAQVRSPAAGTVSFAGDVANKPVISIAVDHRTIVSIEPVSSDLAPGSTVARGQPIGTVAAGGHCDSNCLHLGVRVDGEYVNPLRFLHPRPILLPW